MAAVIQSKGAKIKYSWIWSVKAGCNCTEKINIMIFSRGLIQIFDRVQLYLVVGLDKHSFLFLENLNVTFLVPINGNFDPTCLGPNSCGHTSTEFIMDYIHNTEPQKLSDETLFLFFFSISLFLPFFGSPSYLLFLFNSFCSFFV